MKVQDLFEGSKANAVQVKNKSGTFKRFKSMTSPGVDEWRNSYDEPAKPKREKMSPEDRAAKREQDKKEKEQKMRDIAWDADMIAAAALDGLDPSDKLARLQRRENVDMDYIDQAIRKYRKPAKGFYDHLATMWDDTAGDHIHDAKNGHIDSNSQFYSVGKNKEIIPAENPWK